MAHVIPSLQVGGSNIEYLDSWTHLGHILSSDCRDIKDIEYTRVHKPLSKSMTYLVILEN